MKNTMKRVLTFVMALALVITLLPVSSVNAATKPKLSKTKATVIAGEQLSLSVKNKPSGATVTWSSGAKKYATVSKTGKVTGVRAGEATITAKVKTKATKKTKSKTYTLTCKVTVTSTKTVTTSTQLKAALKNTKLTKITFMTTGSKTYTIPKGTHSKTALVIDTPNAAIRNYGVFKSVTVKSIKAENYTELATGNTIRVTADQASVVVSEQAKPEKITVATATTGGAINLVINGSVGTGGIVVSTATTVNISGTATSRIPVTVSAAAKGAVITSSVPVAVANEDAITITLTKGAEGSTVVSATDDVNVTNQTTADVALTTRSGSKIIECEKSEETPTPTPTPDEPTTPSVTTGTALSVNVTKLAADNAPADKNQTACQTNQKALTVSQQVSEDGKTINVTVSGALKDLTGYTSNNEEQAKKGDVNWIGLIVDTGTQDITKVSVDNAALTAADVTEAESVKATAGQFILWLVADTVKTTPRTIVLSAADYADTTVVITFVDTSANAQ